MADKKISQLTSAVLPLAGTELVPVVQSGATVKVSAASLGAAAAYTPAGTGAVVSTVQSKLRESVSVFDFMTAAQISSVVARDKTQDVTAAIQNALASFGSGGGTLHMPKGLYKTTAGITIPAYVTVIGDGMFGGFSAYDQGCTTIYAEHAGNFIFSLVGSLSCQIQDLCLQSGPSSGAYPQTGLMLGRTGAASCGYHQIKRLSVYGAYGTAGIFSIASEDNYWEDINVWVYSGTAKYCLYTGIGNIFPAITTPLFTSSNLTNTFNKFWFTNGTGNADAACIYIEGAEAVGSWSFYGGYTTAASGSYVEISNGIVDGLSMLGPLTFVGCSGERLEAGDPLYGFKLTCSISGLQLPNLNIIGGRYDFLAGTSHYLFSQSNNLTLVQPNITMKPPEAFPYAQVLLYRDKIWGGTVNLGRYAAWQAATLQSSWAATFSAPFPTPSFMIDSTGRVHLRGTVTNPSTPAQIVIMILPVGYRPKYNMRVPTTSNGAFALLTIYPSGNVEVTTGSTVNVELAGVSFDMTDWTLA